MMNFVVCMMLEYLQIKLEYIMTIGKIIKHDFICFFLVNHYPLQD